MTTQGRGVKSAPATMRRDRRALRRGQAGPTGNGSAATSCPRGHAGTPRKLYLRSYGGATRTKGEARDGWHPVALWCPSCGLAYNVNPALSHRRAAARADRPLRGQLRLPIRAR